MFNMYWILYLFIILLDVQHLSAECTDGSPVKCISMDETEVMSFILDKRLNELIIEKSFIPHVEMIPNNYLYSLTIKESGVETFLPAEFLELRSLDLSFNNISDISFLENMNLLKITLHHNRIEFLNGSDLRGYAVELDLSYNNIKTFTKLECEELRTLNLSHNSIEKLENLLSELTNVEEINLSYNQLRIVTRNETENLKNLMFLNLSHNSIQSLQYKSEFNTAFWRYYESRYDTDDPLRMRKIFSGDIFAECQNQNSPFKHIYLNNNNLTDLNFLLANEKKVILACTMSFDQNKIQKLYPSNFKDFILGTLDLSRNAIGSFPSYTFEGLQVSELRLEQNEITSLNYSSLAGLSNLTRLNFSFNPLTNIDESIFRNISSSLRTVDLSHCHLKKIPVTLFENMKSLYEIYLGHNLIETIEPDTFPHFQIDTLDLSYNRIKNLPENIFFNMNVKSLLDLSFNPLKSVENVFNNTKIGNISLRGISLNELTDKKLKSLEKLKFLDLSNTSIDKLGSNTFDHFSFLETIILDQNSIESIPSDFFCFNKKLTFLSIVKNPISLISIDSFPHKMRLKYFFLTLNGPILKERFLNLIFLEELHFVDSKVGIIQKNSFKGLINLRVLNFENTTILDIEQGAFIGLNRVLKFDERNLFAKLSTLKTEIFVGLKSLESLNFSSLVIKDVKDRAFHGLDNLQTLILSHNVIQNLATYALGGLNNLKLLDLSFTELDRLPLGIFKDLSGLTELHLQSNKLKILNSGIFSNMPNLEILNLSWNQLNQLNDQIFFPLKNLKFLDINSNSMNEFEYQSLLKHQSLHTIGLGTNDFFCNEMTKMLSDFEKRQVDYIKRSDLNFEISNVDGISCYYEREM